MGGRSRVHITRPYTSPEVLDNIAKRRREPRESMVCGCDPKRPTHQPMCLAKLSGEKI